MQILAMLSIFIFLTAKAHANPLACGLCTIAIASGLGISRMLGVNDCVIGVWSGAILLALSSGFVSWFAKKNIRNIFLTLAIYISTFALLLPLYLGKNPSLIFNSITVFGVDAFLVSVGCGALALFCGSKLYYFMREKNGGKAHFPYEKVVLPVALVLIASILFNCIM